jgi:ABC-type bacteriocin/lantibiotic exporter with double-glycine peptidase domain
MMQPGGNHRYPAPSQEALRVLESFSTAAHVAFDRILAARAVGEAQRAIPGGDWASWSRRLVEVGESLNLRIRSIESTPERVLAFVGQGTPVATCLEEAEGGLRWFLVAEVRGRRVRLVTLNDERPETWIPLRRLRQELKLAAKDSTCRWVIGQPALACDAPNRDSGHARTGGKLPPITRLIGLLQPEKKDLWVILIFSIIVGVLALASPIAVEALVNTVAFGRYLQPVVVLAILLFAFLAFAGAMRALITFIVEILQRRLFIRIVEDLAYRLPRVRQQALDGIHGPELVNRFF